MIKPRKISTSIDSKVKEPRLWITSSLSNQISEIITNMSFTALLSKSASLSYLMCKGRLSKNKLNMPFNVEWKGSIKDTVSSFVSAPPPKKSSPACDLSDLSLSSRGGKPHVITLIRNIQSVFQEKSTWWAPRKLHTRI